MYKRVLLKLSGEQLQGKFDGGFDVERARWIADQIKPLQKEGKEIVIMIGGGNYARGAQLTTAEIPRVTADNIGMLATMMNALALASVLNACGVSARALSNIKADQVVDQFTHRRALSHLEKGRVVVVAGGTSRPYLTTDTAAVALALELDCEVVLKATKVDGVFDRDPAKFEDAKKFDHVSYDEALANADIAIMDKAALGLAMEHNTSVLVFALLDEGNIAKAVDGQGVGTLISREAR
jgi:uridylate kinase